MWVSVLCGNWSIPYISGNKTHLSWVMMTSSNGNIFRVTGHLCGKFTGPRWISRTKASDAELWCFLDWVNNREAGDLRRQHGHYDVIVMVASTIFSRTLSTMVYSGLLGNYALTTILVQLPWIFPGAPLKINGAPGNIQGNLTGMNHYRAIVVRDLFGSFVCFHISVVTSVMWRQKYGNTQTNQINLRVTLAGVQPMKVNY